MKLQRGTVVLLDLDPTRGHEQRGTRPCIIVSDPDVSSHQRFPMIAIIPLTGTPGEGVLYPRLGPGGSGLRKASHALIDHLRSVDKQRVRQIFGKISRNELRSVDEGLQAFLGLAS
jgi:mRNA interferase MazF